MTCPDCPPPNFMLKQEDGSYKTMCCHVRWFYIGENEAGEKRFICSAGLHGNESSRLGCEETKG